MAELWKAWVLAAPPAGGRAPVRLQGQFRSAKVRGVKLITPSDSARFLAWTYPNFCLIDPFSQKAQPRRAPKTMNLAVLCILLTVNYFIFWSLTQAFIWWKVTNFSNIGQSYFPSYEPGSSLHNSLSPIPTLKDPHRSYKVSSFTHVLQHSSHEPFLSEAFAESHVRRSGSNGYEVTSERNWLLNWRGYSCYWRVTLDVMMHN